jgi:hypothetical protein
MKLILWIRSLLVAALIFGAGSTMLYSNTQNASEQMLISAIEAGDLADFVAISGGLQQGIERGMGLSVFRNEQKIGELLVTRSESDCSVNKPQRSISSRRPGDTEIKNILNDINHGSSGTHQIRAHIT